jgi:hypothetical protein
MPTVYRNHGSQAIAIIPKIMHNIAKIGLETVIPIFFNPLSTTSVKLYSLFLTGNYIDKQSIFKTFDNYMNNGNF